MDAAVDIFNVVKPKCVELAQLVLSEKNMSGTIELLNALKDLVNTLQSLLETSDADYTFIPINLADYIMVPITKILNNDRISDSELEYVFKIFHILLKYSWCQPGSLSNDLFIQYTTLITFLVGGKPGQFDIKSHSDETFINGIVCIQDLLNGCMSQNSTFTQNALQNNKFIPTLGFLVSILLSISHDSQISKVKTQCLETLNTLFHLINDGEILSLFFPGTVSSIAKIIKTRPHSEVVSQSFITLSTLVNSIFSDFNLNVAVEHEINSLESLKENINGFQFEDPYNDFNLENSVVINIPENLADKKVHRTSSWLKVTLIQFEKALNIILNVDVHRYDKYSVRDSIFQFDVKVIRNCLLSCRPLIPILLKSLSTICLVEWSFLSSAVDSLVYISEIDMLKSIIKKSWNDELHSMQHTMMSPDPAKSESMLQYLIMLLSIFNGCGSIEDILIEDLVQKLRESIAFLIETKNSTDKKKLMKSNTTNSNIETQMMLISTHYNRNSFTEIKQTELFNGIFTKETERLLMELFKVISQNIKQLPQLNSMSTDVGSSIKQSIQSWMISCIIENYKPNSKITIDDFLQFEDKDTEENKDDDDNDGQITLYNLTYSSLESSTGTLQQCSNFPSESYSVMISSIMSLRSINNSIKVLKTEFADELIDVLYPVVECLASSNEMIRIEAQLVTLNIANLLYDGSIEKLLQENSDYLIDSLSSKLVGESLTPKIPIILSILVKLGSMDIVAELNDIINIIFTLLDMYYSYNSLCEGFFLVFNEIISKVYQDLKDYDFEKLSIDLADENVMSFGMWGLKSLEEVDEFINKKAIGIEEMFSDSDNDGENEGPDEPIKRGKILEIDSDDESDDDDMDRKSIPSVKNDNDNSDFGDGDDDDEDKWISPINVKLYTTISNILSYAERLLQSHSISLTIILLKVILRIIPLLATQKNKFLPLAVNIWELMSHLINYTTDLRIVNLCLDVFKELIKYGNTFFTTRFMDVFKLTSENKLIKSLVGKQLDILIQSQNVEKKKIVNASSTSTNWDLKTFNNICDFFIFSLVKLGRFIPNDIAMSIIKITICYDQNIEHYGYFDELADFLLNFESIRRVNSV